MIAHDLAAVFANLFFYSKKAHIKEFSNLEGRIVCSFEMEMFNVLITVEFIQLAK